MPVIGLLRHPVGVLGVFVSAFVVWVLCDAVATPSPPALGAELSVVKPLPVQTEPALPPPPEKFKPSPREMAQLVTKLKPGMTRAEVEGLVGEAAPGDIQPAIIGGSQTTYTMSYEAALTSEPDAVDSPTVTHESQPKTRTLVKLEFDATKPGHLLVGIRFEEPRF